MSAHPEAWALTFALKKARRVANEIRLDGCVGASFDRGYAQGFADLATTICAQDRIAAQAVRNEVNFLMLDYSRRTA